MQDFYTQIHRYTGMHGLSYQHRGSSATLHKLSILHHRSCTPDVLVVSHACVFHVTSQVVVLSVQWFAGNVRYPCTAHAKGQTRGAKSPEQAPRPSASTSTSFQRFTSAVHHQLPFLSFIILVSRYNTLLLDLHSFTLLSLTRTNTLATHRPHHNNIFT
jgi:hypothetical protein